MTSSEGAERRLRYDEGCPLGHALNIIGDRWALLVVRELMLSAKRFQAIREGLPGITPGVLKGRLDQLIDAGLVIHPPGLGYYALTPSGRGLRGVLLEVARWGLTQPGHDPRKFISPTSAVVSLNLMMDPDLAAGSPLVAGFDMGREQFTVHISRDGRPLPEAVDAADGDFVLRGPGNAIVMTMYGPLPVAHMAAGGAVEVAGDAAAAQQWADMCATVPMPAAASPG